MLYYNFFLVYKGYNQSDADYFTDMMAEPTGATYSGTDIFTSLEMDPVVHEEIVYEEPGNVSIILL